MPSEYSTGSHIRVALGWRVGDSVSDFAESCFRDNISLEKDCSCGINLDGNSGVSFGDFHDGNSSFEKDCSHGINLDEILELLSEEDDAESIEFELILKIWVAPSRSVNMLNGLNLMKPIAMSKHRALSACFLKVCLRKFGRSDLVLLSGGFR